MHLDVIDFQQVQSNELPITTTKRQAELVVQRSVIKGYALSDLDCYPIQQKCCGKRIRSGIT